MSGCGGRENIGRGTVGHFEPDAAADGGAAQVSNAGAAGSGPGGATGSAGAGGTGVPLEGGAISEYAACVLYLKAECNRSYFECEGRLPVDDPCPDATAQCPDFAFSTGSLRTVAGLIACAEAWKAFPCDQVLEEHLPDCAVSGTIPNGEPCLWGSQCASDVCAVFAPPVGHPDCGRCATVAPPGAACTYSEPIQCEDGYECGGSICMKLPPFGLPPGAVCERWGACDGSYVCFPDPSDANEASRCQKLPSLGEPCPTVNVCGPGAFCSVARRCEPLPGPGAPCAVTAPGEGYPLTCTEDAFCDESTSSGATCVKRIGRGEPCVTQAGGLFASHCATGLWCACADAVCSARSCVERREEGESCGDPSTACALGTACQSGVCVSVGSQGLFDQKCGG